MPPIPSKPKPLSATSVSLTATGVTNALSASSEAGYLLWIGVAITTALIGNCTANLEIQIDGQATESIPLFSAGTVLVDALKCVPGLGGSAIGDFRWFPVGTYYASAARVGINVTSAAATAGVVHLAAHRSVRI